MSKPFSNQAGDDMTAFGSTESSQLGRDEFTGMDRHLSICKTSKHKNKILHFNAQPIGFQCIDGTLAR